MITGTKLWPSGGETGVEVVTKECSPKRFKCPILFSGNDMTLPAALSWVNRNRQSENEHAHIARAVLGFAAALVAVLGGS